MAGVFLSELGDLMLGFGILLSSAVLFFVFLSFCLMVCLLILIVNIIYSLRWVWIVLFLILLTVYFQ